MRVARATERDPENVGQKRDAGRGTKPSEQRSLVPYYILVESHSQLVFNKCAG